jgi:hypothetical protein
MSDLKNFSPDFLMGSRPSVSRGIADEPVQEEVVDDSVPSPQVMIDALYYALMERLDAIEAKLDRLSDG